MNMQSQSRQCLCIESWGRSLKTTALSISRASLKHKSQHTISIHRNNCKQKKKADDKKLRLRNGKIVQPDKGEKRHKSHLRIIRRHVRAKRSNGSVTETGRCARRVARHTNGTIKRLAFIGVRASRRLGLRLSVHMAMLAMCVSVCVYGGIDFQHKTCT